MLNNRLSGRRIYAPPSQKSICSDRGGFTLTHRLISMLHLAQKDYRCYFLLSKWQGDSDEPINVGPQTMQDWGYDRSEFYQTLKSLSKKREELLGEALIDFCRDELSDSWKITVRSLSKIMDKMAKELENG